MTPEEYRKGLDAEVDRLSDEIAESIDDMILEEIVELDSKRRGVNFFHLVKIGY